jgi:hypothetical protein
MNADWLGWAASALVLATFCMQGMVALRLTALASNVAFIGYGASAGIDPVLMLHTLLLPLNAWRLAQSQPRPFFDQLFSALNRAGGRSRAATSSGSNPTTCKGD